MRNCCSAPLGCSLCDGFATEDFWLFFCWNVHGPCLWLFWSEAGTLPLLTVGFSPVFPTLDANFLPADTTLSVGLSFRQPLLEELMLTKPFITQHPQEAHFVLAGTHFALKRPGISSNCFPLESAVAWKLWAMLPSGHSRSGVWRTQRMSPSTTQGQGWGHQGSRWHREMSVMDWEQIPRDDFKNGAIPHRFQNRFKPESEWNQDNWWNLVKAGEKQAKKSTQRKSWSSPPPDWW